MSDNHMQVTATDADEEAEASAIFQAIKASGAVGEMAPQDFLDILSIR